MLAVLLGSAAAAAVGPLVVPLPELEGTVPVRELAVGLLDELGIDRAVLVGCSAGGTVAFEIALRAPDRVAGLVLLAPAVNGDVGPPGYLRPVLRTPQARRLGPLFLRRLARGGIDSLRAGYHDPGLVDEDDLAGYRRPLRAHRWDRGLYETMVAEAPPHLGPQLRDITAPALVLVGSSDRTILPEQGRRTAEALGDARFHEIPRAGHLAVEERPDAIVSQIDRFLADHDLAPPR